MPQIKVIIAAVIGAIALIAGGIILYQHHENATLNQAVGADKNLIAEQASAASEAKQTIVNQAATAQNTDAANVAIASDALVTQASQTAITQDVQQKEVAVVKKYTAQPQTTQNQTAEATEISAVRIAGLWQTYCASTDEVVAKCAQYVTKPPQ